MGLPGVLVMQGNRQRNDLIRDARIRLGLSREELADAANRQPALTGSRHGPMTANLIGKIEQGRVRLPARERRAALRAVLGVDSDAALGLALRAAKTC